MGKQRGSVLFALYAAIGAVAVVGAVSMSVMKGPVRSMHNVTQKTIAENNMIASVKLAVMATANQPNSGDCDADSTVEPIAWKNTGTGPKPTGGGYLPSNIGASLQDPWGNTYGYCVWDHGSAIQTTCPKPTQRLRGAGVGGSGPVVTIISSGPDRTFQTSCADAPAYVVRATGSDDIVLSYTYAEAQSLSAGLWNLQESDLETAEISKNLEVKSSTGDTTFQLDKTTGIGDFIGIRTGSIAAKGVEPVSMAGGLKVDNETHVTQCTLPQHAGILRYHSTDGLQVCDGEEWKSAGGGAVPMGTIAAFAENECPDGWVEYTLARGRFLRGRDPSGTVDPDGERMAGHVQDDAFQGHHHNATINGTGAIKREAQTTEGSFHLARISAITATVEDAIGDGVNGTPRVANETRPKNVAVTYCQFTGEGDGLGENTDVLNDLSDVNISSPQVGDTLTYDGTVWVNQDSGGGGGDGVPSGAVMPFDLSSCPSGWSEYTPARGRFVRGIDPTGTIDPDGTRVAGHMQDDAFQGHRHNRDPAGRSEGYLVNGGSLAYQGSGWNKTAVNGTHTGNPVTDGTNGTPRTANETRPKNVALLYCRKD